MKTKWIILGALAGMAACSFAPRANAGPSQTNSTAQLRAFMRDKLSYSQNIVEGLTLEKYDQISTNAFKLRLMTQDAEWRSILKNQDFEEKTKAFQKLTVQLMDAARAKNTPDALKSYNNMIQSCVDCHDEFRRSQHVQRIVEAGKSGSP